MNREEIPEYLGQLRAYIDESYDMKEFKTFELFKTHTENILYRIHDLLVALSKHEPPITVETTLPATSTEDHLVVAMGAMTLEILPSSLLGIILSNAGGHSGYAAAWDALTRKYKTPAEAAERVYSTLASMDLKQHVDPSGGVSVTWTWRSCPNMKMHQGHLWEGIGEWFNCPGRKRTRRS